VNEGIIRWSEAIEGGGACVRSEPGFTERKDIYIVIGYEFLEDCRFVYFWSDGGNGAGVKMSKIDKVSRVIYGRARI
jgi:hypothetical protein